MTLQDGYMRQTGIAVREGETVNEISGGLVSYTSIGGEVALDENGTRTPLAGVTVELYQAETSTALQTVQTDESGAYRFDGLWPDEYALLQSDYFPAASGQSQQYRQSHLSTQ